MYITLKCGHHRDPPRSRPSTPVMSPAANLVHFNVQNPTYGVFNSVIKGSQFEYDSGH